MNLHKYHELPGKFCCNDGICIDSELGQFMWVIITHFQFLLLPLVCDYTQHCDENEDETNCNLFEIEQKSYNKDKTPSVSVFKDGEVTLLKTQVNASIRVSSVLDVDQVDASFTVLFNLNLRWNDPHVKFYYLKGQKEQNHITEKLSKTIWMPSIKFLLGEKYSSRINIM